MSITVQQNLKVMVMSPISMRVAQKKYCLRRNRTRDLQKYFQKFSHAEVGCTIMHSLLYIPKGSFPPAHDSNLSSFPFWECQCQLHRLDFRMNRARIDSEVLWTFRRFFLQYIYTLLQINYIYSHCYKPKTGVVTSLALVNYNCLFAMLQSNNV